MLRSSRLLAKVCKYFFLRISHPSLLQVGFSSLSPLVLRDITKMFWVFLSKSVIVCVWYLVFLQVGFSSLSLRTQKWKSAMPQHCDKSPKMLHVLWASSVRVYFLLLWMSHPSVLEPENLVSITQPNNPKITVSHPSVMSHVTKKIILSIVNQHPLPRTKKKKKKKKHENPMCCQKPDLSGGCSGYIGKIWCNKNGKQKLSLIFVIWFIEHILAIILMEFVTVGWQIIWRFSTCPTHNPTNLHMASEICFPNT